MVHPIQRMVESINAKGGCPRMQVDLTVEGVTCPDFVCEQWQERLVIDLDPSWPLELEFTDLGIEANLSFGGHVSRCVFPWTSIYVVGDRAGGRGFVIEEHMPASIRGQFMPASAPRPAKAGESPNAAGERAKLAKDSGDARSRRRRRPAKGPVLAAVADPVASEPTPADSKKRSSEDTAPDTPVKASKQGISTDEVAKRRRSVFRVIDGGG